ncbi:MAG: UDP-3-O-(3-hydroxymyristoyl)glucosamine N-acyltransferase [Verrucomicrobia bacterium]|nr:UDP-3-O-(3-hydroxymyristoyl)glucosamine N-acyltransferase [Verrucomicrobiota bacterium]NBS78834.1 UDP-3-O-(3-hydroxymyristoyl)glucosamine N-acyltransferase [bacterium]NBT23238.1 UDP-3-O-(3-hydroxymyristoyl)glucosamine N-acyltransferase [bacterium]NBY65601.1 UDP-3-O-(3-hydroxymyristoyl)glucosamine N-acyltransferase [Verrucomicrobiota bacterium]
MSSPRSVGELAELVGGVCHGDPDILIHGVADLHGAGPEEISFFAHPRYESAARQTKAAALVVTPQAPKDLGKNQIRVANPSGAFTKIAALFAPPASPPLKGIHPTAVISAGARLGQNLGVGPYAVIEEGAEVGDGTQIGAGSYIGRDVNIGSGCVLHPRVYVGERCRIGDRVVLHAGAVVGADGFGYEMKEGKHVKIPQLGIVQIDNDAEIGANTTIDRGRFARTHIGEGAKIDNLVMIAHNCVVGPHSVIVAQSGLSGSTTTGHHVVIAGHVGTVGHVHLGDGVIITAKSGVTKDVPNGQTWRGAPARPIKEQMEMEAHIQQLPQLVKRLKALEAKRKPAPGSGAKKTKKR